LIEDLSSNGTYIDDELIGKGNIRKLNSGDKIYILHTRKVKAAETMGYVFSATQEEFNELKRLRTEEERL